MKLLADENFPSQSVAFLRELGYDIKAIGDDDPGISDKDVLSIADNEKRTILTFDKDYGELIFHYNYKPSGGIIFLRIERYTPQEPGKIIHNLLETENFNTERAITVYDGINIRQRKY